MTGRRHQDSPSVPGCAGIRGFRRRTAWVGWRVRNWGFAIGALSKRSARLNLRRIKPRSRLPECRHFHRLQEFRTEIRIRLSSDAERRTSLRGGAGYHHEPPNSLIYQQIVGVPPFAPVVNLQGFSTWPIPTEAPEWPIHFPSSSDLAILAPVPHFQRGPGQYPFRRYRIRIFGCR